MLFASDIGSGPHDCSIGCFLGLVGELAGWRNMKKLLWPVLVWNTLSLLIDECNAHVLYELNPSYFV